MGHGLCSHPRDINTCESEEASIPLKVTLAVRLTDSSLTVTHAMFKSVSDPWIYKTVHDSILGFEVSHLAGTVYWNEVRAVIKSFATRYSEQVDTLLLLGEHGLNKMLLNTIRQALGRHSLINIKKLDLPTFPDPVYVAVRGAAELAKHYQQMPPGCIEPERCINSERLVNSKETAPEMVERLDEL